MAGRGSPHASERMALHLDRLRTVHVQDLIDAAPTDYLKGRVRVILRIALSGAERLELLATNPVKRTTAPSHTRARRGPGPGPGHDVPPAGQGGLLPRLLVPGRLHRLPALRAVRPDLGYGGSGNGHAAGR